MTFDPVVFTLSAVAILVSIWAAVKASGAARQQNLIQARLLELESARERDRLAGSKQARLRAGIVNDGRNYLLVVRNDESGQARAVEILVDGKTPPDHEVIMAQDDEMITILGADAQISFPMAIVMGSPLMYEVRLSWEDDSGHDGSWHSQLNV